MLLKLTARVLLPALSILYFPYSVAGDETPVAQVEAKRELSQEEIDANIGRFGETEVVPKGFEFSNAENLLWVTDHLRNIERPVRLYYAFKRSGSYDEGFTDAVYLDIIKVNEDGTKNAILDFFSDARNQKVSAENVTNITGNPVLGKYMEGDVLEMNRLTKGHWRYFQKRIKIALRENATIEQVNFDFNGKNYKGEKIVFSPYLEDPHHGDFEKFANKRYEVIMSQEVPGTLYQIHTVIRDAGDMDGQKQPLIEEILTLTEIKFGS
jgi:hypothetical protein